MCSVLLLRRHDACKHPSAASCFVKPELGREIPAAHETAAKSFDSKLVAILALSALVFFVGGAVARAQKISPPVLSSGLCDATLAPATLPPIDSIGTGSIIGPFLASGVPPDLTRAALRCAWSTDLTIRGFIGLSENSWDFNAPGVPGFGSLTTDDAHRLLTQVMEGTKSVHPERLAGERLVSK